MTNETITATQLAEATGLTRQAIYMYEDKGLLTPSQTMGKYRLYTKTDIERVNKIQKLKKDYHLPKIKELLDEGAV
jgi:DNA-binding transcriptional MerR regulator